MDFQRRTLLAIVVCVLIWVVYASLLAPPPPELPANVAKTTTEAGADAKATTAKAAEAAEAEAKPASDVPLVTHKLKTDLLALEVGNVGGFVRRTELLIFLRPLLIDEPGMRGGYAEYAGHLPDDDFLISAPSPGQRNFPHMPLRPLLLPAGARPDPASTSTERQP